MEKIKNWLKINFLEWSILLVVLGVGAFLRLHKIDQYMTFLGDEGRDVIIVMKFIKNFDLMLIGPGTSVGNMYLGPLYYYLMAPALLLANFSPVGPAIQIAVIGVITIALVWWVGREWFPSPLKLRGINGLFAALFYAISPTVIVFSRSSWNPNIMPFFSLLCIYSLWKIWKDNKYKWLIVLGICYAFVMQSHYLGLLLAPTIILFWFLKYFKNRKEKMDGGFIKYSLIGLGIFVFLMSPLVIFDSRHGWRNFDSMKTFFTVRENTVSAEPWSALPRILPLVNQMSSSLMAVKNQTVGMILSLVILILIFWNKFIYKKYYEANKLQFMLIFIWLGFAIVGLGLYRQEVYDHYYGFVFTAPFLLLAGLIESVMDQGKRGAKLLLVFLLIFLVYLNLDSNPLKSAPNQQLKRAREVAKKITEESKGERYNLAVLADRNYQDGYKYFLLLANDPVVEIDSQREKETVTNQLFVVCEMVPEECDPTHSPRAEVANFGWSKIETKWEVFGARLYKLVHTK